MKKIKIFKSNLSNPFQNLAIENKLLEKIADEEKYLFIYVNAPSIVMGRFQNPWVECDIKKIIQDDVFFVRRQSGGGSVYHDLGNVNYSFINGSRDHEKNINNEIILKTLEALGITAHASGRSDIIVDFDGVRKISGSAFKQKKSTAFHHGTMLIDTNLEKLGYYLNSKHGDIEASGVKSVKSNVINLIDINKSINEKLYVHTLGGEFSKYYEQKCETLFLGEESVDKKYYQKLLSWDWAFGETPRFEYEKEEGGVELSMTAKKGVIESINLNSVEISPFVLKLVCDELCFSALKAETLDFLFQHFLKKYRIYAEDFLKVKSFIERQSLFL